MSASAPKTRNARAPRTKAKAAAPEKTAQSELTEEQRQDIVTACGGTYVEPEGCDEHHVDCECVRCVGESPMRPPACDVFTEPVHQRWTQMFALLSKGRTIELSTPARVEAWEWFRDKSASPRVAMVNKSPALVVAGMLVFESKGILCGVRKGGRK